MSGRRVRGSGLVRGLVVVVVSGLVVYGCGKAPEPEPKMPTVEEQVQEQLDAAEAALTAGDLEKAEAAANEAEALQAGSAGDVLAKIQAEKEKIDAQAREKEIQAAEKEAQDLLAAGDLPAAKAKAAELLKKDPENQVAKDVLAKVEESAVPRTKKDYDATSAKINAAIGAKNYREAIRLIDQLEQFVDERAGLPSRKGEKAGLEKKQNEADGDAAMRAGRLDEAIAKYRAAGATSKLRDAQRKKDTQAEQQAKDRRYDDAMRNGRRQASSGQLDAAIRSFEEARRNATDGGRRRRADREINRVRRELDYRKAVDEGDKALARGDYDGALASYRRAQSLMGTPEVSNKIQEAGAVKAEAEGDSAVAAGDWATAVAKYGEAQSVRPTAQLADKLAKATAEKARGDYLAKIEGFKAARKARRFMAVMAEVEALAKAQPDWPEAKALLDEGPLAAEKKKIEGDATKAHKDLMAKLGKIKDPKKHSDKIALIRAALPKVRYSSKEKTVDSMLKREMDALLQGKYKKEVTDRLADKKKPLKGQAKIDYLNSVKDGFKDSGHYDKIEGMIKTERSSLLSKDWSALLARLGKLKRPQDKIAALRSAQPKYAGTIYEKQIATKISNELNTLKRADYVKLVTALKKLRKPDAKIAEIKKSRPNFKGTRYEAGITKQLFSAVIAKWKGEKDPKKKIAILEAEAAQFAGTRLEGRIKAYINKGKSGLEAAVFGDVSRNAAKLKGQKKLDYLMRKQGEFKSKTYQGKIKGMIDAAKKTLKADEQKAKDAAAKKVYDKAMADARKLKDNAAKLKMLTEAVQKVAGTRYVDMLNKEIKRLQPKPKAPPKKK